MKNNTEPQWAQFYCSEDEYNACREWAKGDPAPRGLKPIVLLDAAARPARAIVRRVPATPRRARGASKGASRRASEKSGDGNDSDPDPDPARRLLDQAALAQLLCISKKTLQNQYSSAPHTLPAAISIPGARGPRWTQASVQAWLEQRPQHKHTSKPTPPAPQRKVGRPRIARIALVRSKGGAA
ncbi:hypothetical protein HF668_06980 [Acidithiobacillus ferridurans]|uniref:helix-turn-helix transcriptional regulator n=1 Tax=Acidithiobacillus ferridurans TaxID=1232575 RepID=UPI001C06628A|nr:hypothetical protein [Acidithiobacillus ferridurans]MBU2804892.1 hypothetical protein [Acidithiobacillus ferridurans]